MAGDDRQVPAIARWPDVTIMDEPVGGGAR